MPESEREQSVLGPNCTSQPKTHIKKIHLTLLITRFSHTIVFSLFTFFVCKYISVTRIYELHLLNISCILQYMYLFTNRWKCTCFVLSDHEPFCLYEFLFYFFTSMSEYPCQKKWESERTLCSLLDVSLFLSFLVFLLFL